ncbi:ribonuclease H-like domain-containing protein [Lipomyces japonicus]|uniref:ribonuclease H-like domain-containing protein n=1 Tax=Lipomyces japonicus TaxID=56871 RepID=UPI0034CED18B
MTSTSIGTDAATAELNKRALLSVLKVTQDVAKLTSYDLDYLETIRPEIKNDIQKLWDRLLDTSNALLKSADVKDSEGLPLKLANASDLTQKWSQIGEINDQLFEKADTNLDIFVGVRKPIPEASSGPSNRALKKKSYFSSLKSALNIPKPQLLFKTKPDNFATGPFKPLLTQKPNALISLEESLKLEYPEGNITPHYRQPYEAEILTSKYPKAIVKSIKVIQPLPLTTTKPLWINNVEQLNDMVSELEEQTEIAVDLEHHDMRSYVGFVSLMQISTRSKDYLIDTLKLREELEVLNKVFTNRKIVKVFHGATSDIVWLQRDFGLYIVSLFDTFHAASVLNLEGKSLSFLLDRYCSFKAAKEYQLADWRTRPLTKAMEDYARSDTHFLLNIYDQMRIELLEGQSKEKIESVLQSSRAIAASRYEREEYDEESGKGRTGWKSIMTKFSVQPKDRDLVIALNKWRDVTARRLDEGVQYLMSNYAIFMLARARPRDAHGVARALGKHQSEILMENADQIIQVITDVLQNNKPLPNRASFTREVPESTTLSLKNDDEDNKEVIADRERLASELFGGTIDRKNFKDVKETKNSTFWGGVF